MMQKNKLSFKPQSCKRYNHPDKPRTALYTDSNTNAWYIESLSTGDLTVVQTKINSRSTLIASCYFDINLKEVIPTELEKTMIYAKNNGLAIILGIDSNAQVLELQQIKERKNLTYSLQDTILIQTIQDKNQHLNPGERQLLQM